MYKYLNLILLLGVMSMLGCVSVPNVASSENFDTSPFQYWQAKVTDDVQLPAYLANSIVREPLYPIPNDSKLSGELKVNKAPPTLADNIQDIG